MVVVVVLVTVVGLVFAAATRGRGAFVARGAAAELVRPLTALVDCTFAVFALPVVFRRCGPADAALCVVVVVIRRVAEARLGWASPDAD